MTKLEEKLIKLGYEIHDSDRKYGCLYFVKRYSECWLNIDVEISVVTGTKIYSYVSSVSVNSQQDIDNIQQAFNQLQSDLEVLKECI